ncbi:MAG TPA: 50S ribosomal protein L6 [Flavobacteriales bacterium]|jgi:large subunit ribosomal protein L6|nr:50S ribosomal protein L6 [Flavobacteriales bacterium]
MSRIGKEPIVVPEGIELTVEGKEVRVKGKLGELKETIKGNVEIKLEDGVLTVTRGSDHKDDRAMHGLYRSLVNNMIVGVSEGYKKDMELVGVGFRATSTGQQLDLSLGYSHNIIFQLPEEITVVTTSERGQNPTISLTSYDKQLLGQVAAKIRSMRKPEPYKGKGVRFVGEEIRRKAGKSAG